MKSNSCKSISPNNPYIILGFCSCTHCQSGLKKWGTRWLLTQFQPTKRCRQTPCRKAARAKMCLCARRGKIASGLRKLRGERKLWWESSWCRLPVIEISLSHFPSELVALLPSQPLGWILSDLHIYNFKSIIYLWSCGAIHYHLVLQMFILLGIYYRFFS